MILLNLLFNLRSQGLKVGLGEWLELLRGLELGLAEDLNGLYFLARSLLVHDEAHFDAYDLAFTATFKGVELPPKLKDALAEWLAQAKKGMGDELVPSGFESLEAMLKELQKRMNEQKERHDGGNYWIGTGGTSPFGNSGRAEDGIRIGGEGSRGGAVQVAQERQWASYRTDMTLDVRDFSVALGMLRRLAREGEEKLDIDGTIQKTASNGGEIELDLQKERVNRVRVLLLMDVGGSMDPHAALVSRLFTAASQMKMFKTFDSYYFHNAPYAWLYEDYRTYKRKATMQVLSDLTPQHRVIWVGDASMAPWELFSSSGSFGQWSPAGIDNIKAFAHKVSNQIWLNPDPPRFWDHPTVNAIRAEIPMFPLTVEGLRQGMRKLRGAGGR